MRDENRRMVGVIVTGDAVAAIVREGKWIMEVPPGVPTTAAFVRAHFDHSRNSFVAIFTDESFYPVAVGCEIPLIHMPPVFVTAFDKN